MHPRARPAPLHAPLRPSAVRDLCWFCGIVSACLEAPLLTTFLLLCSSIAHAGDGPWTLAPGDDSLYLGVAWFQYGTFDAGGGSAQTLSEGVSAFNAHAVWTTGLADGLELELVLPWETARVNDPTMAICADAGDFCKTTSGLGDVSAALKLRLVDELYGSPVTIAAAAGARTGEAYADERDRLTTLGDGTTDFGAGLSLGRTDVLGARGWYRAGVWGWYWRRMPNTHFEEAKVPADDLSFTAEATVSPHPRFGVGPALQGFQRLGGVDLNEARPASDPWGALAAAQIQAGGKLGVYSEGGVSLSVGVLRTVYARNNPTDTVVVTAGLGWYWPAAGRSSAPD